MRYLLAALKPATHVLLGLMLLGSTLVAAPTLATTPPDRHALEWLANMVGRWSVTYEGPMGSGTGILATRLGPAGRSAILDFRATSGTTNGFELLELIVWNGATAHFEITWIDSFTPGLTTVHANFRDSWIQYERSELRGHVLAQSETSISPVVDGQFTISTRMRSGQGEWRPYMHLTYTRIEMPLAAPIDTRKE